jgi:hypothetical protein
MMIENRSMWRCIVMVVALAGACTKPNPQSCADGTCTDPAFPFCDVDGAVEGTAGNCIAVDCTPGELAACRGNQLVQCNATGNDFDVVMCPMGCDEAAGGCLSCTSNDQCSGQTPVCAPGGECRACLVDSECDSQICDADSGSCVAEARIVYAAPTGGVATGCSLTEPCTLTAAIAAATENPSLILRLLPGSYGLDLTFDAATAVPLKVVATGAVLVPPAHFDVFNGATVEVRGLEVRTSGNGSEVDCVNALTSETATLTLSSVVINVANTRNQISVLNCRVRVVDSDITINSDNGDVTDSSAMNLDQAAVFDGDSLHIRVVDGVSGRARAFSTTTKTISLHVKNSVIENARAILTTNPSHPNELTVMFSTFIFTDLDPNTDDILCGGFAGETNFALLQNNIFYSTTQTEPKFDPRCRYANNVVFPFSGPLPGNILRDPLFVNVSARDLHLQATSPAVDAATAPLIGTDTPHDFDGSPRPQGVKGDIGAFELTP